MSVDVIYEVVLHDALKGRAYLFLVGEIAQTAYVGHILSDQLVHKTALPKLEIRYPGLVFTKEGEGLGVGDAVFIVFSVEEVGIRPCGT